MSGVVCIFAEPDEGVPLFIITGDQRREKLCKLVGEGQVFGIVFFGEAQVFGKPADAFAQFEESVSVFGKGGGGLL